MVMLLTALQYSVMLLLKKCVMCALTSSLTWNLLLAFFCVSQYIIDLEGNGTKENQFINLFWYFLWDLLLTYVSTVEPLVITHYCMCTNTNLCGETELRTAFCDRDVGWHSVTELLQVMHLVPDNFPDSVSSAFKWVLCRSVLEISAMATKLLLCKALQLCKSRMLKTLKSHEVRKRPAQMGLCGGLAIW